MSRASLDDWLMVVACWADRRARFETDIGCIVVGMSVGASCFVVERWPIAEVGRVLIDGTRGKAEDTVGENEGWEGIAGREDNEIVEGLGESGLAARADNGSGYPEEGTDESARCGRMLTFVCNSPMSLAI